ERLAFFDPKLLEQQVVVIEFDESGVVRRIRQLTEKDGYPVQMVERVTPSPG
ncbi:MAG: outer membrane protein assembly factor BamE, partial [Gemmatimonadetes bacterium]|nr:outer membrane protein assembly factor BamE [Gemmatimonadota bacterium]NIT68382.1 outer membrane protein assembly factor BamE [Gemmatimonadota bacterium]NIW76924.1 outer membrane protein assembly factor BamE [Gemmatimonadota bacterium]NIY36959.1 outer membrane protein assembly factor BamE [Gemmatimonadota bacterium]